ncbi:Gfo/Idh/MocA family oxidoreductase [Frigoribacterium sp. CFBP 8766]|uniref:Gfo/Idh/MocA family protein n=1 Tax=Frigoribacterium sp. CFBP 8766 TaxID=2775273 RepID=UPI0017862A86|nr:Gfo/Idh/MocA family oxidoreductase [Frigoribacterium sp. CFBP 8766]MBD8585001.1 Gfo/Idh/MocA family oxidoreductase [Frigoribacterium sp. CFBP 8766]
MSAPVPQQSERVPEPQQSRLRVGIVGYGLAGRVFHAPLVAADDSYDLVAVVTRDSDRADQARTSHPGVEIVPRAGDLDELGLDLVVVATPNATHADVAADALRAGSAVVVDKPVATTASSARQLIELAESLGRSLTVYQNRRWDGDYLTASRLVRDGALGDVHTFESRFEPWKTANRAGWKSEATAAEGGGILLDLGPHLVDQALHLFGPVVDVHAEIARRRPSGAADDDVFVSLRHEGGVRSRLWMSHVAAQPGPRLRVLGTARAYVVDGLDPQEAQLASGTSPRDPGYGRVPDERHGLLGIGAEARPEPTDRGRYPLFYEQLARALRGAGPLPVDPRDALAALEVIEAARESAGGA